MDDMAERVMRCETNCESMRRLDKQVNGNGQPGLRQDLAALAAECHEFFTENKTSRTKEMEFHNLRDREIKDTLGKHDSRLMLAISILALLVAILGATLAIPPAVQSLKELLKSDVNWHKIIRQDTKSIQAAHNANQNSTVYRTSF
ncbi:MAG TPA: hypothetical protein VMQ76_02165 [Terracidiphilus sp.]|nr:hypothetical protein [Terracidiphilus sp.]